MCKTWYNSKWTNFMLNMRSKGLCIEWSNKNPTYVKKKKLTKTSYSIGEFYKLHYKPMLQLYEYHMMLLCVTRKK